MIELGITIKKLRLENRLSQKALARQADLTPSFVSLIENDRRVPSMAVITKVAGALGVPEEVLIWDAVELPSNLREKDRRLCEMAKLIVRRFYEQHCNATFGAEKKRSTIRKQPSRFGSPLSDRRGRHR